MARAGLPVSPTNLKIGCVGLIAILLVACAPVASPTPTPHPYASSSKAATPEPTPAIKQAEVVARVPLPRPDVQPAFEGSYATTADTIWVADARGTFLVAVDAHADRVTSAVPVDPPLLAAGDGELWMLSPVGGAPAPPFMTVSNVNRETGVPRPVAQVEPTNWLAVGLGAVWVVGGRGLTKLDQQTGKVTATLHVSAADFQLACGSLWSWVPVGDADTVLRRLDPDTGTQIIRIELAEVRPTVFELHGGCWLLLGDRLFEIDPDVGLTGKHFQSVQLGAARSRRRYMGDR